MVIDLPLHLRHILSHSNVSFGHPSVPANVFINFLSNPWCDFSGFTALQILCLGLINTHNTKPLLHALSITPQFQQTYLHEFADIIDLPNCPSNITSLKHLPEAPVTAEDPLTIAFNITLYTARELWSNPGSINFSLLKIRPRLIKA